MMTKRTLPELVEDVDRLYDRHLHAALRSSFAKQAYEYAQEEERSASAQFGAAMKELRSRVAAMAVREDTAPVGSDGVR